VLGSTEIVKLAAVKRHGKHRCSRSGMLSAVLLSAKSQIDVAVHDVLGSAMRAIGPLAAWLIMILLSMGRCSLSDWRVMEMAFATKETRPASTAWLLDGGVQVKDLRSFGFLIKSLHELQCFERSPWN